jgi:YesN/AraC family two-component response regulator
VIVTDINMPEMDGVKLLKRLREKEYDLPVIVMTGDGNIQASIKVLRLGAFDFLLKPFQAKELLSIFDKLEAVQEDQKKQFHDLPFFTENIDISIRSQLKMVSSVGTFLQNRIRAFCKLYKINVRNIGLCLHEALINAIIHGNLQIPSSLKEESSVKFERLLHKREASPKYANKEVKIRCQITTEHLKFVIEDEGQGFKPQKLRYADPFTMNPSGRGILLIKAFMDNVSWNETGNCITMIKDLRTSSPND